MRILLVEDDDVLLDVMQRSLLDAGHRVDAARRADEARHLWRVQPFDAVLLDLNLPDGSGLAVLRDARARGDRTPVLVLTARNRTDERIAGLDAGADDYLGKPFDLGEVEARLRALARRGSDSADRCTVGALVLERKAGRFFRDAAPGGADAAQPFDLPAREHAVLVELMTPPGRVVSKRELSNKLSSFDEALGDNALEAFISRLRKKLAGTGATIRTLRGLGYLVEPGDADPRS
jgi:two-component system, OmpR family, response regulator